MMQKFTGEQETPGLKEYYRKTITNYRNGVISSYVSLMEKSKIMHVGRKIQI